MAEKSARRRWRGLVTWSRLLLLLWAAAIGVTIYLATLDRSPRNVGIAGMLVAVFLLVRAQGHLAQRALYKGLRDLQLRLENASYLNEFDSIPNRNYLLDQLRREMPRARAFREPFVLVVVSMDDLEGIMERRGEVYGEIAKRSLARLIERFTRASDFASRLGDDCYCVLLYDCTADMASAYLRRIPGTMAVSTGKRMLEVPLTVRMSEYDMESLYAIDVLRDAEEASPAREAEPLRFGAEAA